MDQSFTSTQLSHNATATGGAFANSGKLGELREGAMGSAVRELQSKLNVLQYGPIGVDGNFGAGTKQALMAFQSAEGLPTTGTLDAETEARLNQRILSVSTGAGAGTSVGAQGAQGASAPTPGRPWWQTALMVSGGIAIVGGIIYLLTDESDGKGYKRALASRTVEHDPNVKTKFKRAATLHGVHRTKEKCDRSPDEGAFADGELLAPQETT